MKYLIIILVVLLVGCDNNTGGGEVIKPTIDRTGMPIITTTYYYDSVEDVMDAYRDFYELPRTKPVERILGFAAWPAWRDEDGNVVERTDGLWCEIHSIRPKRTNDQGTLTHGHEGVHCVYGSYHRD